MKDLIIFGAGSIGKFIFYNIGLFNGEYNILGFMDEDKNKTRSGLCGLPVFGTDYLQPDTVNNLCIVVAVSSPVAKEAIINKLKAYNLEFPNFISFNSWLSEEVTTGCGIIIYPNSSVNYETKINDFVTINAGCSIGHNVTIGKFSTLAPGVCLAGFTDIEEKVDIGIGSCSRQKVKIGCGSVIGGQTMLIENVMPGRTVVGVPAKIIK